MALPTSGKISIKDILIEMKQSTRTNVSLNTLAREWFDVTGIITFKNLEHKLSDWYGKSWHVPQLSISPIRIDVPHMGGLFSISVTCNGPWSAKINSGEEISSIYSESGNGNGTFRLRVDRQRGFNELQFAGGKVIVTSGNTSVVLIWIRTDISELFE